MSDTPMAVARWVLPVPGSPTSTALRGKYKVTVVIDGVPLRKADGSALPMLTVNVPTAINSSGAVVAVKPVTGMGLIGFITLSD